jgi:hypothetical protein
MKAGNTFFFFVGAIVFCAACSKGVQSEVNKQGPDTTVVVKDTMKSATYDLSLLTATTLFAAIPQVSLMQRQDYKELSGVAPSHAFPGLLYVHEDSGNANEVYVTSTTGEDVGKLVLDGINNRDWEDIAVGPGPEKDKNYVYVAEIGDNNAVYKSIFIYRFPEPDLSGATAATIMHITAVDKIELIYPKGPVNAESLMIDPATRDLYIATKEGSRSTLYVARYPQSVTTKTTLLPLVKLPFDLLTAGDISPDGNEILLRNTGQVWYWKRLPGESVAAALLRQPQDAPYARNERQGEGICFAIDNTGYFTDTEIKKYPGEKLSLSFYKRK